MIIAKGRTVVKLLRDVYMSFLLKSELIHLYNI